VSILVSAVYTNALLAVMLNEAKTSRPELRGRGQFLEVEAKAEAKSNYEKVLNNDQQDTI